MPTDLTIRNASQDDFQNLSDLIHFGAYVHRHLDWRSPLDWLGHSPFVILERGHSLLAALSCPTELEELSWIRLFAYSVELDAQNTWQALFERALQSFPHKEIPTIAALSLQNWFTYILLNNQFRHLHNIVVLQWVGETPIKPSLAPEYTLRPMLAEDLPAVETVDHAAFERIWQISFWELQQAFQLSIYATVLQHGNRIVGYQISTANGRNIHLARLAVHKDFQRQHLGSTLVFDLLNESQKKNADTITVNTQHTNQKSLALYQKMNFFTTNEQFPVLVYSP